MNSEGVYMRSRNWHRAGLKPVLWMIALAVWAAFVAPVSALINPKVQPKLLYDLYKNVMVCRVTAVDTKSLKVEFDVIQVTKGDFAPKKVVLTADAQILLPEILALEAGQQVVVFAGGRRASARDVLYYVGAGKWYKAQMESLEMSAAWRLTGDADADKSSNEIMFGVYNGSVQMLWQMMEDVTARRQYYPARPFTRFAARKLDVLNKPAEGVAIFDVNGDGRLDIVLASPGGVRVYLQNDKGDFGDSTEAWGLASVAAKSVGLADVDGDGKPDLLFDGGLFLQREGRFVRSDLVPKQTDILSAAFVQIGGDGYPDVVISRTAGGLAVYRNTFGPDPSGRTPFAKITTELGLDQPENGASGTGYFEAGDWDGDGRTDLLYLSGPGYLLLAGDAVFAARTLGAADGESGYMTAAMAPLVSPDRNSALVLLAEGKRLLDSRSKGFVDVTRFGNEIQDDVPGLFTVVAEDLNADGTIDLYAANSTKGAPSFFCTNRGYGSFMLEEKYSGGKIIPPEVYNTPVLGAATGDLNGDGANDMVLTGADGIVWLLMNQTLVDRKDQPEASTLWDERKQIQAKILTVRLVGLTGVLGASVRLLDEQGQLIAWRQTGGNIGIGCCGPQQVVLVAREPGKHKLEVRFADGAVATLPVDLSAERPRHQIVSVKHPGVATER